LERQGIGRRLFSILLAAEEISSHARRELRLAQPRLSGVAVCGIQDRGGNFIPALGMNNRGGSAA
jgi:hypothetical protein